MHSMSNVVIKFVTIVDGPYAAGSNSTFALRNAKNCGLVLYATATDGTNTADELKQLKTLQRDGIGAAGIGLSSTWSTSHTDHTAVPVPSRHVSSDEVLALCAVVKEFPGTTLEFIPQ